MNKISNFRILYVEDDETAKESMCKYLDLIIEEYDSCYNGEEALSLYKNNNYDLIITDLDMPKLSGIELISHIREDNKLIPIIITTARSESNELMNAIELNVTHYLLKPLDLNLLYEKIKDIYNKKFLSMKLKETEKELETIFNTTKDAIVIIDEDSNFLKVNNSFEEMTQFSFEELKQKKYFDFFKDSNEAFSSKLIKKVVENGSFENIEKTLVSKNNNEYHVITSFSLMPDRKKIVVSIRDITEMKSYSNLIDKNIISAKINFDGKIDYASQALCDKTSYDFDELIGQDYFLLVKQENPNKIFNEIFLNISKGQTWDGEIKIKTKNNTYIWLDTKISPTLDINKSIRGYTIICQDITDKVLIKELSITDSLTNAYNRRHFDDIFPKFIRSAKRDNLLVTLIILDIDFFKQYNDTYGHQKGDIALSLISQNIINQLKRADDMFFRLGGEEFAILLKSDSKEKSITMAQNIKETVENLKIEHEKSLVSDYVTISLGLVCEYGNDIDFNDLFFKKADDLLYKSKKDGRNKLSF